MTYECHPETNWKGSAVIGRTSTAYGLTISGGYVFIGRKEMLLMLKLSITIRRKS